MVSEKLVVVVVVAWSAAWGGLVGARRRRRPTLNIRCGNGFRRCPLPPPPKKPKQQRQCAKAHQCVRLSNERLLAFHALILACVRFTCGHRTFFLEDKTSPLSLPPRSPRMSIVAPSFLRPPSSPFPYPLVPHSPIPSFPTCLLLCLVCLLAAASAPIPTEASPSLHVYCFALSSSLLLLLPLPPPPKPFLGAPAARRLACFLFSEPVGW